MRKLPINCPSCQALLRVSSLSCNNCNTLIKGEYELPIFLQLSESDQEFIFSFVLSGGSLKAMAKQMGKSYPTVRNRLDDIIKHLSELQNTHHEKL